MFLRWPALQRPKRCASVALKVDNVSTHLRRWRRGELAIEDKSSLLLSAIVPDKLDSPPVAAVRRKDPLCISCCYLPLPSAT